LPTDVDILASGFQLDSHISGRSGLEVSTMITSGDALGDQWAGLWRGFVCGSVGKAQAPSPGQALLFMVFALRDANDAFLGFGIIAAVISITVQEFLREVRIVVIAILIRGRW
jgi:hypothetical protein